MSDKAKVVVVGDAAGDLAASLAQEGWDIVHVDNAQAAAQLAGARAVVCDARKSEAALQPSHHSGLPSLAVVASCEAAKQALDAGYSDVVVTSYDPRELQLRVQRLLRVTGHAQIRVGAFVVSPASRQLWRWVQNWIEEVKLTPLEFDLLLYLVENAERAVGYDELLVQVWGCDYTEGSRETVRSCVKRVRCKIESDPSRPHYLLTVRGVGYRWAVPPMPVPPQPPAR